jgi:hypothetical protein
MFNFKQLIKQSLLAAALLLGSGAALANPIYQVTINTAGIPGTSALMDFGFHSNDGTAEATATLSNFGGAFGAEFERMGSVAGDIGGSVTMSNASGVNFLTQEMTLGGLFTFDIAFGGEFFSTIGSDGALFFITLYDEMFNPLAFPIDFSLLPMQIGSAASIEVIADADLTDVNAVPEPSDLLLLLTGLALIGLMRRSAKPSR